MLNTSSARHQVVWIDDFQRVLTELRKAWEQANSFEKAHDEVRSLCFVFFVFLTLFPAQLPVSLVLNPEFASMSASSADESSPRGDRRVLRLAAIQQPPDEELNEDAVSDEYDSEHAESLKSIERVAVSPAVTAAALSKRDNASGNPAVAADKGTQAVSPSSSSWSDVKI